VAPGDKTRCGPGCRFRTLASVFRFAVFVARVLCRAALTAALALLLRLLSSAVLAHDGTRR
jgi:hypothetical protein